uniref:Ecotropic viral integration site 2B n=1 Tax=Lepisosteus oculatus TaxID=7918 RepID=W5NLN2_LEPOC|nr:PREDICTED: protein EVI2B [Lepisosteus oculatus]
MAWPTTLHRKPRSSITALATIEGTPRKSVANTKGQTVPNPPTFARRATAPNDTHPSTKHAAEAEGTTKMQNKIGSRMTRSAARATPGDGRSPPSNGTAEQSEGPKENPAPPTPGRTSFSSAVFSPSVSPGKTSTAAAAAPESSTALTSTAEGMVPPWNQTTIKPSQSSLRQETTTTSSSARPIPPTPFSRTTKPAELSSPTGTEGNASKPRSDTPSASTPTQEGTSPPQRQTPMLEERITSNSTQTSFKPERTTLKITPPSPTPKHRITEETTQETHTSAPFTYPASTGSTRRPEVNTKMKKMTEKATSGRNADSQKEKGAGTLVAVLIGGALILMLAAIAIILLQKWRRQQRRAEDPNWAGPSPFLDGQIVPQLPSGDEEERPSNRSSKRVSLRSFLPQRLSKRLSLLQETDENLPMEDVMQGSTFGRSPEPSSKPQNGHGWEKDKTQGSSNSRATSQGNAKSRTSPEAVGGKTNVKSPASPPPPPPAPAPAAAAAENHMVQSALPLSEIDLGPSPTEDETPLPLPPPDNQASPPEKHEIQPAPPLSDIDLGSSPTEDELPPPPPLMNYQSIPIPPLST